MRRILPWLLGFWTLLLAIAWFAAWIGRPDLVLPFGFPAVLTLAVGSFLIVRVQRNLIGPLLFVGASASLIYDIGTVYAVYSLSGELNWPAEHLAAWLGTWTQPLFYLSLPVLLVLFPDGRFGGRRKWFLPPFGLVLGLIAVGAFLAWGIPTEALVDQGRGGLLATYSEYEIVDGAFIGGWLLAFPAAISMFLRYRRSERAQRQQIKWLLFGAIFTPVLALLLVRVLRFDDSLILAVAPSVVPIAIGVAVVRYRLYDLGQIVSRTVTYAVVVTLLGLAVASASTVVGTRFADPVVVAATTLAVAALFNPLRRRVQGWVDRRFNRSRYDAERVMEEFAGSLQDRVDPDGVIDGWVGVVAETMQPAAVGGWVREG
jgi:hypothetical protein